VRIHDEEDAMRSVFAAAPGRSEPGVDFARHRSSYRRDPDPEEEAMAQHMLLIHDAKSVWPDWGTIEVRPVVAFPQPAEASP
jgi:hypothetical protein